MRLHRVWLPVIALALSACGGTQKQDPNIGDGDGDGDGDVKPIDMPPPRTLAQTFDESCRAGLEKARQQLPALLAVDGARSVDNLLIPYNELLVNLMNSSGLAGLMSEVHPNKEIRDVATKCSEDVDKFASELSRNRKLFEALASVDTKQLDPDTKRMVERELRDFRRAGVDKDEPTRMRLKAIDEELTKLGNDFQKNIREDVRSIEIDPAGLAGMPPDWSERHKPNADGKVVITTDYPDYIPFMTYADSGEHRKAIYIKFKARADQGNEKILRDILKLRKEKSGLLGYANWADYITEDKMVGSSKNAADFIEKVVRSARARGKKDYDELLAFKRKKIDKLAKAVEDWEKSYIENKLKAEKYKFDSQSVRPYFAYKTVETGLLDITSKIYGVRYVPATEVDLWHEDVKAFDVFMEEGDEKLGRIFLDMHPRDGKYKHAAQFPYKGGVAGVQLPEGVLVCNFPNPRTDGAALMEHAQVETMFHEFGHLMHHVFGGQQRWLSQSGVATEWDFVEAPSQMFEEWAQAHETLSLFAKHNETSEVIPEDLVERMNKASRFGLGTTALQQMFYASVSLNFHTTDPAKLDMAAEVKRLQIKYTPFPYVEGTAFHTNFGHLNGYSAIYYTYMWSLVIAKDLLTPFKKNGLMNLEWTRKYRDSILAPGGTKDAAVLVKDFLGRDFNYNAFADFLKR